ncbi:single-stranded DNA-binding protein [Fulvivirga sp. M361]|uniref:single-stranded DNA-binding protein n=1 Tax=Fulvivirga sp. M361 TaxID=2594266 RepID=UPI00117BB945|nr:single-stranded DNA-binding protein [Fulvivirga sp. M361]TRX56058.1 single-stranded DNA-binding protein [Fulvivirga sp. M361]
MRNLRNTVQLIGRLGKDPELRKLKNGKAMTTFSLATSDVYKNAEGEKVQNTQWHHIVAWGRKAEMVANYLSKGQEIAMEGRLVYHQYETTEGEKRYLTEISMNELLMVGSKK